LSQVLFVERLWEIVVRQQIDILGDRAIVEQNIVRDAQDCEKKARADDVL